VGARYLTPRIGAITKSVFSPGYRKLLATLRDVRDRAGLSQREVARRLEVAPSWVAKVEIGERRLDVVEFVLYVRAVGADPEAIFALVAHGIR